MQLISLLLIVEECPLRARRHNGFIRILQYDETNASARSRLTVELLTYEAFVLCGDSLVIVQALNGFWRLANKKVRSRVAWAQNAFENLFQKDSSLLVRLQPI